MIIALILLSTIAFANCLKNDFIGDDKALFIENEFYASLKNAPLLFSKKLVMDTARLGMSSNSVSFSGCISYRPVPAATFFLDYAVWKTKPVGHHLTNLVLHVVTVVLVFLFLSFLLPGREKTAFFAAALFAVHPIQSEVVNTIGYRSDLLATLFFMLGLVLFVRGAKQPTKQWHAGIGAAYFLALFSKETALTFPFVIFLLDLLKFPPGPAKDIFRKRKALYVLLALITAFYLFIYFVVMPNAFYPKFSPGVQGWFVQAVLMLKVLANYLKVLFLPFTVTILPPLYSPPAFPLAWWELVIPIAAVILSVMCAGHFYRKNKIITFAFLWILVNYLPVSGVVPLLNPFAFRFLYLPSVGFFLLAALSVEKLISWLEERDTSRRIGGILKATLIGLSIVMTISNNGFFRNDFTACHEMVRNYPESSRPYWVLGLNYYLAGKPAEAEKYLEKHVQIETNNPFISDDNKNFMAYHLLGRVAQDPDKSLLYLKKAQRLNPRFPVLYLDLAKSYILKRDLASALEAGRTAVSLDPKLGMGYVYIIHCHMETGQLKKARQVLRDARKIFGDDPNLRAVEVYLKQKEDKDGLQP